MKLFDALVLATAFLTTPAIGATVNGDFSQGLTGYTARAETNLSGPQDPTGFVGVGDNAGNPFGQLTTDPALEALVLFTTLSTRVSVTSDTPLFSFDFGSVFDRPNSALPPGFVPSFNSDRFSVQIRDLDAAGTIFDLGLYTLLDSTVVGTVLDPLGNAGGFDLMLDPGADPFFSSRLTADLSSLAGKDLEISFTLRDFFDGRQSSYGIDNIQLSDRPVVATVPLPASMWLLAVGVGGLGLLRRRRPS